MSLLCAYRHSYCLFVHLQHLQVCWMVAANSTEERIRACITASVKQHFALPKDKQWLIEFAAESILIELVNTERAPDGSLPSGDAADAADDLHQASFSASNLPGSDEAAAAAWGPLFFDNLDDVDPADVASFSAQLLSQLQQLAEQIEAEQGLGSEEDGSNTEGACELCERIMPLTKHHLIPRDVHKEWKKRGATFEQLNAGAMVCRPCHNAIHRIGTNKQLAELYNTVEVLQQVPSIQRHVAWARKQKVANRPDSLPAKFRHRR